MRAFIVLCLVAVACADKLGYNYQPVGRSDSGLSFAPGSGSFGAGLNSGLGDGIGSSGFSPSSNLAPSYAGDYSSSTNLAPSLASEGDYSASSNNDPSYAPQVEFDKEFYTYTANEDDFNAPAASNQLADSIKQGLRVVFIKGPENSALENAALALAKHASDQKTDIYVLRKEADIGHLADKLNNINKNTNNKPEVRFVKYRTPEDAEHAKKAIQGQYDTLGGSSQSHNGGVVPVLNFASQAPVANHKSSISVPSTSINSAASEPAATFSPSGTIPSASYIPPASASSAVAPVIEEPSNTYLPASILRLFRL